MSGIVTVIEEILVAAVIGKKVLLPRISKVGWTLTLLSILLGCAGIFLLILSLDRFLEARYPSDIAVLILAGVLLAVAVLMAAIGCYARHQNTSNLKIKQNEVGNNIQALIMDICDELDEPIQDNPKMAVFLAAFAGFLTAQQQR